MSGNKIGAAKARDRNLAKDPNFYRRIGALGGAKSRTGGFYQNPQFASEMGKIGGVMSKRTRQAKKRVGRA